MRSALACLIACCVSCVLSAPAGAGPPMATCAGKVVDAEGRPLAEVTVAAYEIGKDRWSARVTTGWNGRFSFRTVKSRKVSWVTIVAHKKGMGLDWSTWSARNPRGPVLTLGKGAALTGTVVDRDGKPVVGAEVCPRLTACRGSSRAVGLWSFPAIDFLVARTDTQGRFRFAEIPEMAGASLSVTARGKAWTVTEHRLRGPDPHTSRQKDIRIVMADEARVSGTVVDKTTGLTLAGVRVRVEDAEGGAVSRHDVATTNKDGTFTFGHLRGGRYAIASLPPKIGVRKWPWAQALVTVKAGQTVRGVKLALIKGGTLEVKVIAPDRGEGSVGTYVQIRPLSRAGGPVRPDEYIRTDGNGIARTSLAPGKYRPLMVDGPAHRVVPGEGYEIVEGKTTRVEVKLRRLPVITGIVRDVADRPVGGAEVFALSLFRGPPGEHWSDEKGRFEMPRRSGWPRWRPAWLVARVAGQDLVGKVAIGEKPKASVEIKLAPGARITGRVLGPTGKPIGGAMVRVAPRRPDGSMCLGWFTEQTDREGRYEFRTMPLGIMYNARVNASGYGEANVRIGTLRTAKAPLRVESIVLREANLSVSGVVLGPDGKPVAGVHVYAERDGHPWNPHSTRTDEKGRFRISKLCKGRVRLSASTKRGKLRARIEVNAGDTDVEIDLEDPNPPPLPEPAPQPVVTPEGEEY